MAEKDYKESGSQAPILTIVDVDTGIYLKHFEAGKLTLGDLEKSSILSTSIDFLVSNPKMALISYLAC